MLTYLSPVHRRNVLMPQWVEGFIALMDTLGSQSSLNWPCCVRLWERVRPTRQAASNSLRQRLCRGCNRTWCGGCRAGRRSRRFLKKMVRFQPRRWVAMAKRRPIAAIAVLGLLMFLFIYVTLADENYERIGIDMLAEKEKILQDINNDLQKSQPMDDRQIFQMDQNSRRDRFRTVCDSLDKSNRSGLIHNLITSRLNLTYCVIPRSDNTFWLQVFRYLHHDYISDGQLQSPFELDAEEVHSRPFVKTRVQVWKMLTQEQRQTLLHTKIFMSVQDPYMRLWSTYLRALVLPEMWSTVGARIYVRRPKAARHKGFVCARDVTFGEFATYVLDSYEKDFAPYYTMCDPCQLTPHYTVKAETAHRDNQYILEHFKLAWAVKGDHFQDESVASTIRGIISGSYKHLKASQKSGCSMDLEDLNLRLWKTFVMEGILPEALAPPPLADVSQSQLADIVLRAHRDALAGGEDMTSQKRKFMVAAYKNLTPGILESLEDKYEMDFKLFSYDRHPHDIFGGV